MPPFFWQHKIFQFTINPRPGSECSSCVEETVFVGSVCVQDNSPHLFSRKALTLSFPIWLWSNTLLSQTKHRKCVFEISRSPLYFSNMAYSSLEKEDKQNMGSDSWRITKTFLKSLWKIKCLFTKSYALLALAKVNLKVVNHALCPNRTNKKIQTFCQTSWVVCYR